MVKEAYFLWRKKTKEPYPMAKEPYPMAKEPYPMAKEPYQQTSPMLKQ
jgi:hypothetical protein